MKQGMEKYSEQLNLGDKYVRVNALFSLLLTHLKYIIIKKVKQIT